MEATRIYADFNGLILGIKNSERTAVVLDTFGSLRDLANMGVALKIGLPLITFDYSDDKEDLEGHGTAEYDPNRKWWVVEFDEIGVRYVPAGNRTPVHQFLCVSCKEELQDIIKTNGLKIGDTCPSCGTEVHDPIAPPIE